MDFWRERIAAALVALAAAGLVGCNGAGDPGSLNLSVKQVVLTGAQENPAVTTAAAGTGTFTFDLQGGAVFGSVSTFGLNATAAHIHVGAAGTNGPVIVPLTEGPPGVWSVPAGAALDAAQLQGLAAGNLYVNVHSAAHPGGEIRAQIGRQVFYATLTGAQEVPPATTAASGTGRFVYDPETRRLSGTVNTVGVAGTAAHVHTAAIGAAGPVTIPMTGGPTWTLPETALTPTQAADLLAGRMYANVHSAAFPGGEIRGQIYAPLRRATLTGAEEVPPVTTGASGTGWLAVNPFTLQVAGRIETTLTAATAAHVHRGAAGVAGPVVIPLASPAVGVWTTAAGATLTDELLARFMEGNLYYNVHSAAHPGGEIRGQLVSPGS